MEIDCRREEARHPGSLCTPLPSRPLYFLNSPPDILGPRSAGPKTSSSGEQTPEGVLGSLFLLATARSYSGPGVVGRIRTRGRGRVQPYPRLCAAHVPSRSDESDRAHEPLLDRSKPFYDISVSKRCALLGPFSCALRACSDARDHNTTIFSSPKGEGFRPSPEETLIRATPSQCLASVLRFLWVLHLNGSLCIKTTGSRSSIEKPESDSRHLHAGHRLGGIQDNPQTYPGDTTHLRFRCHVLVHDESAVVYLRSSF